MTRRRLIVGAAGSNNGFGTIQSVRDRYGDSVLIVAIDTSPRELVGASALADAFVQVPPARSPAFPDALRGIAETFSGGTYLPLHDHEIEVASRLAEEGRLPTGLDLVAPPHRVMRLCSDKWQMHQWLVAHGLPSPVTALAHASALATMPRPAMLKPREGFAGDRFALIRDAAELANVAPDQWILQEVLVEPEVGIDVFLSRDGRVFRCLCREYREKRATVATKARLYSDSILADIAERLARGVPLIGAFLFQVMRDETGQWRITDVNPRVGSATRMSAAVGMDFAAANLADHWNEPTEPLLQPFTGECYVVRQYADYLTRREGSRAE